MEWISVKDRLPETDKKVLLYHINDCFVIGFIKSYGFDDLLWWFWWEGHRYTSSTNSKHITHWMPLPEPPRQETITIIVNVDTGEKKTMTVDELTEYMEDAIRRAISRGT